MIGVKVACLHNAVVATIGKLVLGSVKLIRSSHVRMQWHNQMFISGYYLNLNLIQNIDISILMR